MNPHEKDITITLPRDTLDRLISELGLLARYAMDDGDPAAANHYAALRDAFTSVEAAALRGDFNGGMVL